MRGDSISGMTVAMEDMQIDLRTPKPEPLITLLRRFLAVQESRAQIYSRLKRGFSEYLRNGAEGAYQRLCSQVTTEFNDCSKQVLGALTPELRSIGSRLMTTNFRGFVQPWTRSELANKRDPTDG